MPTPRENEDEDAYISRCMASEHMQRQFPEQSQRAAVCHAYWDKFSQIVREDEERKRSQR